MLLKPFKNVIIPGVQGRAEQLYVRSCPTPGGGSSNGSTPTPGQRCTTIFVYGPPSPYDGTPTVISYQTVCV